MYSSIIISFIFLGNKITETQLQSALTEVRFPRASNGIAEMVGRGTEPSPPVSSLAGLRAADTTASNNGGRPVLAVPVPAASSPLIGGGVFCLLLWLCRKRGHQE